MNFIKKIINRFIKGLSNISKKHDVNELKHLTAQILIRDYKKKDYLSNIGDTEFKIYSQWGEDGIIQYLINKIPINNKVFIEFGVENYIESNTRFLLENDNWSGLVMDGSKKNIQQIKKDYLYWKYDLQAKDIFITKDNINNIIKEYIDSNGYNKEIGLLSIDIDGNDYFVWDAIDAIDPVIVICEYNWIFGNRMRLSVPYDENFIRSEKHHSNLYFGASINALYHLGQSKGYEYIGCNKAGNNAFFIKQEYTKFVDNLVTNPSELFNEQKTKESRNKKGELNFVRGEDRIQMIKDLEVLDLESRKKFKLKNLIEDKKI